MEGGLTVYFLPLRGKIHLAAMDLFITQSCIINDHYMTKQHTLAMEIEISNYIASLAPPYK